MFAHLNTHSYYSLGWGVRSPEDICKSAKSMNCEALAITDINSLYGLFFFLDYAREFGIRPIVGTEIVTTSSRATLLVKNRKGYSNLCRIITDRHINNEFSLQRSLLENSDGLVILTDNIEILSSPGIRKPGVYAELIPGANVRELLKYSQANHIKPVATSRAFWTEPDDFKTHRLHRAISLNTTLQNISSPELAHPESRLLNEAEMREIFSYCPEAVDNTLEAAARCNWTPDFGIVYPDVQTGGNGKAIMILRDHAYNGAKRRYGELNDEIRQRLEFELEIIEEKGYAPVFLVVEDIINKFPRTCGRGSAAASIVSYCLGITHVEPVRHRLFFERFINRGRTDPPDIDVDFAWDERDDVLEYVFKKYGEDRSAMVANHVTYQKRAAIREIAKVYGLPEVEIKAVTGRMSHGFTFLGLPITEHPALKDHEFPDPWPEILEQADKLEDVPRHLSVHCGGVVLTPGMLSDWVPSEIARKGVKVIQWEKDQTEDSGLVKIDLLGNRSLAVIRDTINAVNEHYGLNLDYTTLNPLDDQATQQLLADGGAMGVFYVESPATRQLQKKAGIGDYEHLVLHSSIIRPAANPYIHKYLARLKGEPWEPLHPLIGDVLDENYGIMVYQEDVTRVAMSMAGFSLADAEELRKIISKKHKHRRLADLRTKFFEGAGKNGAEKEVIEEIWDMIMSFAGYSFCKPHSASYALVSFKSAYLKAHYPAEFMAAVISNQGGFYSTFAYVSEAKRMGIDVLPPDINESNKRYFGRDGIIRIGFMQIKGLSDDAIETILDRRSSGSFRSFDDCLKRCDLHPSDVRLLVKAGCFDRLEPGRTRPELLWKVMLSSEPKSSEGQASLFDTPKRKPPRPPQYDERTLLMQEVEILGFLVSRHPLDLYRDRIRRRPVVSARDLGKHVGKRIEVAGWLVTGKVVSTKNREPMEFVTFEDTTGLIETTFFPNAFKRFSHTLSRTRPYRLCGLVEEDYGALTLTVERVEFL